MGNLRSGIALMLALLMGSATNAEDQLFWGFLETGKDASGYEPSELEEMQAKHLGNFRRLGEAGKLLLAGPVADSDREQRGIVVLKMADLSRVEEMFEPDPFVKNGLLNLKLQTMTLQHGAFDPDTDEEGFDEWVLVGLRSVDEETTISEEAWVRQAAAIKNMHAEDQVVLSARMKQGDWHQILVLPKPKVDEASPEAILKAANEVVGQLPLVKAKLVTPKLMPLYAGKGRIKP